MPLPVTYVSEDEMRRLFNERYLRPYERRDLTIQTVRRGTPAPSAGQVPGAISVMQELYDRSGQYVGRVHLYINPDGSIGASGKPDPKELIIGRNRYKLAPPK